ncbi:MAG: chitobiase/beta-hexosaminidase C-terminal domain-containing protein [Treponema sp.]|nr:chitobiase/beta-hexosaminidase C-terminal domain-containing protein [Treponema sp.]
MYAFSEKDIISPISGTWNNTQPLVLNVEDKTEIYYSLMGTDPLKFGFAYDGPVVLDQKGDVSLQITAVDENGERQDFFIEYAVKDINIAGNEDTVSFVNDIINHPIKRYVSGSIFSIPETFNYFIGKNDERTFSGNNLHISEKNNVKRYVPFTVTDGSVYLHFVLQIIPLHNSSLHSKYVPFSIENWNVISFSSEKYVYSIDDGLWVSNLSAFVLDRLKTHIIRWKKSVESDNEEEEIFSYALPPMPQLVSSVEPYGQVTFSLMPAPNDISNSMNYKMGKIPQNLSLIDVGEGLYDSITLDAFNGEELLSSFLTGVYYDGVYQGVLQHSVIVDRLAPLPPVLSSVNEQKTILVAEAEEGATVYYSVSDPVEFDAGDIISMESSFSDIRTGEFQEFKKGKVILSSISENPTFYKIQAYAMDKAGNQSEITEFRILVDEHNFYLNPLSITSDERDGSYLKPFATFEEAVAAMNGLSRMKLHIIGNVDVKNNISITSDCDIIGKNSSLIFSENAVLTVDNASVSIKSCSISKETYIENDTNFIIVNDGILFFDHCQVSSLFSSEGILVESVNSELKFDNTSLVIYASSYACNVKSVDSYFLAADLKIIAKAHTCVNLSILDTFLTMKNSVTDISAHIGRSMECIRSNLVMEQNTFKASLDANLKYQNVEPVWKDADTVDYSYNNTFLYNL